MRPLLHSDKTSEQRRIWDAGYRLGKRHGFETAMPIGVIFGVLAMAIVRLIWDLWPLL